MRRKTYTILPKLANGDPVFAGGLRGGSGPNDGRLAPSPAPAAPPAAGAPSISLRVKLGRARRPANPPPRPLVFTTGIEIDRESPNESFPSDAAVASGPNEWAGDCDARFAICGFVIRITGQNEWKLERTAAILACNDGGIGVDPLPLPLASKPVTPFGLGGRGAGRVIAGWASPDTVC